MMKNYERYLKNKPSDIGANDIMTYICRQPSDHVIVPLLQNIAGCNIVEVGIGAGYYTRYVMEHNKVLGVDQNPQLCELPVEIRKGDTGLLVKPRDTAGIRKAIESLVSSQELRQKLAAAALECVQLFSWKNVAGKFVELYEQIIRESAQRVINKRS